MDTLGAKTWELNLALSLRVRIHSVDVQLRLRLKRGLCNGTRDAVNLECQWCTEKVPKKRAHLQEG